MLTTCDTVDLSWTPKTLSTYGETIRKDSMALEGLDFLKMVHGGSLPVHTVTFEEGVDEHSRNQGEKRRIAQRAIQELPFLGTIFIGSGSTTQFFSELLPDNPNVVVFTKSVTLVQIFLNKPATTVFVVGIRSLSQATVGSWGHQASKKIQVHGVFLAINALSLGGCLSTRDRKEAEAKAEMIARANRSILMVDDSKFDQDALFTYARLVAIDLVATGTETPEDIGVNNDQQGQELVLA